jgi:hypothetical protein
VFPVRTGGPVLLSVHPVAPVQLVDPAIVQNVAAFPDRAEYVGLDARTSLPPLLRPGVLMDWEAWWAWEARSVALISSAASTREALDALAIAVEQTRTWIPGDGSLLTRVNAVFAAIISSSAPRSHTSGVVSARRNLSDDVIAAVPADLRATVPAFAGPAPPSGVARRFLLAHAFANWTGYLGQGLRTWLRSLEAADVLLQSGAGVRTADLLLRHLADPFALADAWSRAEGV